MASEIYIYAPLRARTGDGKAAFASQVYDEVLGKFQSEINKESDDTLYRAIYDMMNAVMSEDIYAEHQEYRAGKWWMRGSVTISVPNEGNYMVRLMNTEGGDIRVGSSYYSTGGVINLVYEGVDEIVFEAEDWVSMERIIIYENIIYTPTKLSELEQDIIWAEGDTMYVKE